MRFAGKVAVVTGAGSGIGRATAIAFADEGASVLAADIDLKAAQATADQNAQITAVKADVSKEADAKSACAKAVKDFGHIDILVNNAAAFLFKSLEATSAEWHDIFAVNVIGQAMFAKYAVPEIRKAGGGAIVNIASMSSFIGQPGMLTYNTTKTAILGLTRCLAVDLAPDNIRVNAVAPGITRTGVVMKALDDQGTSLETFNESLTHEFLQRRMAEPEEVASAVKFLASEDASYITGTCLMVDGGATAV